MLCMNGCVQTMRFVPVENTSELCLTDMHLPKHVRGHHCKARPWKQNMRDSVTTLPVVDAVTDYEKIERIGEGTFGIVCTSC